MEGPGKAPSGLPDSPASQHMYPQDLIARSRPAPLAQACSWPGSRCGEDPQLPPTSWREPSSSPEPFLESPQPLSADSSPPWDAHLFPAAVVLGPIQVCDGLGSRTPGCCQGPAPSLARGSGAGGGPRPPSPREERYHTDRPAVGPETQRAQPGRPVTERTHQGNRHLWGDPAGACRMGRGGGGGGHVCGIPSVQGFGVLQSADGG